MFVRPLISLKSLCFAFIIIVLISFMLQFAEADSGGTDDEIEVEGTSGGGSGWNVTHGFVLTEQGEKVDEEFDITICEDVKFNSGEEKYEASGHVFGDLQDIHWDDDPEASIQISEEDYQN